MGHVAYWHDLIQIEDKPTRITESGESLFDVICASKHLRTFNVDAIERNTNHLLVCYAILFDSENAALYIQRLF